MSRRPRLRRWLAVVPLGVVVALFAASGASSAPGDAPEAVEATAAPSVTLTVPAAQSVTPSGNAPSPAPTGSVAARRTPQEVYDPVVASWSTRAGTFAPLPEAAPARQNQFPGEDIAACCARPPDTHGAVGLKTFVEVTNSEGVTVFNKNTGAKLKQTSWPSFFGYSASTIFDPRVVYDKTWNRFVIVATSFPLSATVQNVFLAVSQTSNPSGAWWIYGFDVPEPGADDFFDYPQLGIDQDAVLITANIFDNGTPTGAYLRSRLFAPSKAQVYNGLGFSAPYFDLGAAGTVAPPIVEDANANTYLMSWFSSSAIRVFRASNLGRSAAGVVFQADVPIPAVTAGPPMRQPGSGTLGPPTGRFQNNSTQIGDALLNVHSIALGSFPAPKWYQLDVDGAGANTVFASGTVFESGSSDDSNPAVVGSAVGASGGNPIGRMFFTWTATDAVGGSPHQARVKGTGRLASDPTSITGGADFGQAPAAYNPTADNPERWGDYSAVSIDPTPKAGCGVGNRAYLVNELQTSASLWGSRFGRLGFC